MKTKCRLGVEQLYNFCSEDIFEFETTQDVEELKGIIGQQRAVEAIDFGLKVKRPGYNIFISGLIGTGRNSYAESIVKTFAANHPAPKDWCYVYNFDEPDKPQAISMEAGFGISLYKDMESLIEQVKDKIPKAFSDHNYDKKRADIIQNFQSKTSELMEELNEEAIEKGFVFKKGPSGIVVIPLKKGRPMTDEEIDLLSREQLQALEDSSADLQIKALGVLRKIRELEKEVQNQIEEVDKKLGFSAVENILLDLEDKYSDNQDIISFILKVKEDIKQNIKEFKALSKEDDEDEDDIQTVDKTMGITNRYKVNLFIDSSKVKGAPVVSSINPSYYNLFGRIEYQSRLGILTTDFTKIKAGDLHRANGGYLIVQAMDILTSTITWNCLKRSLKNSLLSMENLNDNPTATTSSLRPQPIPLDVKIIMIGNYRVYQVLYNLDEDFRKLFKIKAEFEVDMERSNDNIQMMANFIATHCNKEKLPHFDKSGVCKIVEYSSRVADNQNKLSARFNDVVEIIHEAAILAQLKGDNKVMRSHVDKAISQKVTRSRGFQQRSMELIEKDTILIDTQGSVIGQVNGLAVLDVGDYSFGKPSRITATTYAGQGGIINIERESSLSGSLHDKGVLILTGYLGSTFAQHFPLSLSANICFEQNYGGVDGDSASTTELYAILSSLSGLPIDQGIAVTGSVNQRGQVQAIGGVNQKIEGYYSICKAKGLTGKQGVMIPKQNVDNLMLEGEILEAVKQGKFHIYSVDTIQEGIEILTGVEAGSKDELGYYEKDSVFGRVYDKLFEFNKMNSKKR